MGFNWAFKPLTDKPSQVAKKVSPSIDAPRLGMSNFNRDSYLGKYEDFANRFNSSVRGAGAGMLEGLGNVASDMTSPLSIAANAVGLGGISRLARSGSSAARAIEPTVDVVSSPAVRQVVPNADEVGALIGDLTRNLAKIPSAANKATTELAPFLPPDLIPKGSESIYNAGRSAMKYGSGAIDKITESGKNIQDLITAASRSSRGSSPVSGNIDVLEMMRRVTEARNKMPK